MGIRGKAGTTTVYSFSDNDIELSRQWFGDFNSGRTHPVGRKEPIPGVRTSYGNVWEWMQDWYDLNYYASSPKSDPPGPNRGSERVVRGGSWHATATNR